MIIEKKCQSVNPQEADQYIGGYCLALDMTARTLQEQLKKQGHPWLLAKGFDTSCPCGDLIEKDQLNGSSAVNLWLSVNGELRQNGNTCDMIFPVQELIAYISKYITLDRGDLILTGTPSGVGPVRRGDLIEAGLKTDGNFQYSMKFHVA